MTLLIIIFKNITESTYN